MKIVNRIDDNVENKKLEIKEISIHNNMLVALHKNKALLSGTACCITSCSMILVNKYALSSYNFNATQGYSTEPLKLRLIKVWLLVDVIFVGMLITSMSGRPAAQTNLFEDEKC